MTLLGVDLAESADEDDLADLEPEFVAVFGVATECPSKHYQGSATVLSADVWKSVEGRMDYSSF